jgi:DNA-binding transcriptional LysR family regulator
MQEKIDYRYLKAFYYTAKFSNFSKAAIHLSIAQSAVSRQIKLLEESIGEQLILRSSKQVLLTAHGTRLLHAIESFEKNLDILSQQSGPQTIKIGILHGLLENWFIPIIKKYIENTPHNLQIFIRSQPQLSSMLFLGELDLIFTTEDIQGDLITSLKIFEEELVLISHDAIDEKKIAQYNCLIYGEKDPLYVMLKNKKLTNTRFQTVESITAIVKLVKLGLGIAVVPRHVIEDSQKLKIYPFKVKEKTEVYIGTHNYLAYPGHLNDIIKIIQSHC